MNRLLKEVRGNPLLGLILFVPVLFIVEHVKPEAGTLLFVISILAIVPLAVLLSKATESVAARTGDTVGSLLNATLGNLTELVIALAALKAGQYMLVKASIAGAIVTNTLFMLGASFLVGGLKHHTQQFNVASARLLAAQLFLATIALLVPSTVGGGEDPLQVIFTQKLSLYLAVLLIVIYGLGLFFSLKTHRQFFSAGEHEGGGGRGSLATRRGAGDPGRSHCDGCPGQRGLRCVRAGGRSRDGDDRGLRRIHRSGAGGWCG